MRLNRFFLTGLLIAVTVMSCKDDDDNNQEMIPDRDRDEVEQEDQEALAEYLDTHFYNYEDFENPEEGFDYSIVIDTIAGANSDKTPLSESGLIEKTFNFEEVDYTVYILKIREGEGDRPKFSDDIYINYKGETLNRSVFDQSVVPMWFNLVYEHANVSASIPGFQAVFTEFRTASGHELNPDNTVRWNDDYGVGAAFLPSGLGYFSRSPGGGIPAYSPLVFSFKLMQMNEADHDGDGIPSWMEDLNENGDLFDDDTDGDGYPNFMDPDDDGDQYPTRDEIIIHEDGTIELTDSNNDGTPDYLDPKSF